MVNLLAQMLKYLLKKMFNDFFLKGDLGWAESYIEEIGKQQILLTFLNGELKTFKFSKFIRGK